MMQTRGQNQVWRKADTAFLYCAAVGWPVAGLLVGAYLLCARQPVRAGFCLGLGVLSIALRTFLL
jgi:hypothetical protein